jgi:hypothetical protein
MLKITRVTEAGSTRGIVSGRIGAPQLPDLGQFLEAENASKVVLDLTEVSSLTKKSSSSCCDAKGRYRACRLSSAYPRVDGRERRSQ